MSPREPRTCRQRSRALAMATQLPGGPVYLSIPQDDWAEDAAPVPARQVARRTAPDPDTLARAARALDAAHRPAMVLGAEVDRADAWDAVVQLAERVRCEVYLAPNAARQSFPGDHPLFRGGLPPAQKALSDMLAGHDVILVIGAAVFDYMVHQPGPVIPQGSELFQFTTELEEAARAPAGDAAVGDVGLAIEALTSLTRVSERAEPPPAPPVPAVEPSGAISDDAAMEVLQVQRPEDSIILIEASSQLSAAGRRVQITRSGGFYYAGRGGLGFALPAAVGVGLAEHATRTICVIGDGACLYSLQSLWTAVEHGAPVTVVVLNNGGYNSLKASADLLGLSPAIPGLDVPGVNHVKLAEGFGCPAERVEALDQLKPALQRAFRASGPMLIDVMVDSTVQPLV